LKKPSSEIIGKDPGVLGAMTISAILGLLVVVSSIVLESEVYAVDSLIALSISGFLLYQAIPVFKQCSWIILQTTPTAVKDRLAKSFVEIEKIEGVMQYHTPHFWTQSSGEYVGSLVVKIRGGTDEQEVLAKAHGILGYVQHLTIQIEKEVVPWLSALGEANEEEDHKPNRD